VKKPKELERILRLYTEGMSKTKKILRRHIAKIRKQATTTSFNVCLKFICQGRPSIRFVILCTADKVFIDWCWMESTRPRCGLLLSKFHDRRLFHWRDSHSFPTFVLSFSPYSPIWEVPPFRRVTIACSQLLIMPEGCLLHPHFACKFMFEQINW